MKHGLFLAFTYLVLAWCEPPALYVYLAIAYLLLAHEVEITRALDPMFVARLRERVATLLAPFRPVRIALSAGAFTWRWPRA